LGSEANSAGHANKGQLPDEAVKKGPALFLPLDLRGSVATHATPERHMDERKGSTDGRIEHAKDVALGRHHSSPSTADEIGEAAGGISGTLLGAGVGAAAGPLGAVIGGVAGAVGGWWAGRAVSEAAEALTEDDDAYYRRHFETSPRNADQSYGDARTAYFLGHIASHNPNFTAREFDEVEPELERGWSVGEGQLGPWMNARSYAREGYERGRERRARARLADQLAPRRTGDRNPGSP